MKIKTILAVLLLACFLASVSLSSCQKIELHDIAEYSAWMDATASDCTVFAEARTAWLDDPENANSPDYDLMLTLTDKPSSVRTQTLEEGKNYQFAFSSCTVTVFKDNTEEVGRVIDIDIEIEEGSDVMPD